MRHQPSRHEVVVVSVKTISTKPFFIREVVFKFLVLENVASISYSTPRQAWETAIHIHARCAIKIPSFQVESIEVSIDPLLECGRLGTSKPLIRSDPAVALVFERSQNPLKQLGRPEDIVVGEDGNVGTDLGYRTDHLTPLVGIRHTAYLNPWGIHLLDHQSCSFHICVDCDQDDFERFSCEYTAYRLPKKIPVSVDGRYDDGNILRSQVWTFR